MFALINDLAGLPAGPDLGVTLLGLDFACLSEAELLSVARAWERQDRFVSARRNALYAALDASPGPAWEGHPAVSGPGEWADLVSRARSRSLAGSTGMSNTAAALRIDAATELTGRLAETGDALEAGLLSEGCARLIARRLTGLDDVTALAVQDAVLLLAPKLTHARLDRLLQREIAQCATEESKADNQAQRRNRRISAPRPQFGGMASIEVRGPAEDIAVLHTAIAALGDAKQAAAAADARVPGAQRERDCQRDPIAAVRFDALIDLACGVLAGDDLPTRHGRRPSIQLTVPAATLLGISEAPGELDGHGPIDADTARAIAADPTATWRRILTDPQGRVLDYGQATYRPPQALEDLVIARDRTCTSPGCSRPARQCQLDHTVPYPIGATSAGNLDAKCGTDHNLKTVGLFTAARNPLTGDTTWTDRHGTAYVRAPETLPIAPDAEDRLGAVTRALRAGRHEVTLLRSARSQRFATRGGRVADPGYNWLPRLARALPDDPPPF